VAIREFMNKNPMIATVGAGVVVLVGIVAIVMQMIPRGAPTGAAPTGAYYTDDDGKTFFTDDASNIPPYDHGGKQAVSAFVFKDVNGGDPFVLYMMEYSPNLKAKLESLMSSGGQSAVNDYFENNNPAGVWVKKPGDEKWLTNGSKAGLDAVKPPKGSDGKPMQVIMVPPPH
jgi:hypothetical protein